MNKMRILGLLLMFSLNVVFGQAPKFSNDFLNLGVGARGMAMGGAVVSLSDDVTAGYWNPSALAQSKARFQIAGQHAQWYAGIGNYDYAAFGKSLDNEGRSFGAISLIRMGIDDIPNTLRLRGPDGSIDYSRISSFSVADYALIVSYGRKLENTDKSSPWSLGGSVKIVHRSFGSFAKAYGFGIDAGILYHRNKLRFSVMGRDITTTFNAYKFSFTDEEKATLQITGNEVPGSSIEITLPKIIAGISYQMSLGAQTHLTPAIDIEFSGNGTKTQLVQASNLGFDPRIGVELEFRNKIYLRGGIGNFQKIPQLVNQGSKDFSAQPSGGLGLRLGKLRIDYAMTNIASVGIGLYSHYISLILDIR
ncbi:MAG: PorV/PorQ family protein [Saprospiraceae bacterium]